MLGDNENIKKHGEAIKNAGPLKQCGTCWVALLICMPVPTMLRGLPDLSEQPVSELWGTQGAVPALVGGRGALEKLGAWAEKCAPVVISRQPSRPSSQARGL